jgi:membrane associated rhomboid family serine protease
MSAYRQSPFANLTPVVKNLLIINFICFIPCIVLSDESYQRLVVYHVGAFYFDSPFFKPWQPITYMFFHGGFAHILFNMLSLFFIGPILEYAIGSKRFFNLYAICGIGAIAFQMVVQAIEVHSLIGSFTASNSLLQNADPAIIEKLQAIYSEPVIGASGAIFGVMVGFGMIYPDMELMMFFIPVPIKAKYFVLFYIGIEIWSSISPGPGDHVAHLAHLGGALLGFIMIKIWRYR